MFKIYAEWCTVHNLTTAESAMCFFILECAVILWAIIGYKLLKKASIVLKQCLRKAYVRFRRYKRTRVKGEQKIDPVMPRRSDRMKNELFYQHIRNAEANSSMETTKAASHGICIRKK